MATLWEIAAHSVVHIVGEPKLRFIQKHKKLRPRDIRRSRFIHHKFSKKMLVILFTCMNVGNDLNFAFSLLTVSVLNH